MTSDKLRSTDTSNVISHFISLFSFSWSSGVFLFSWRHVLMVEKLATWRHQVNLYFFCDSKEHALPASSHSFQNSLLHTCYVPDLTWRLHFIGERENKQIEATMCQTALSSISEKITSATSRGSLRVFPMKRYHLTFIAYATNPEPLMALKIKWDHMPKIWTASKSWKR